MLKYSSVFVGRLNLISFFLVFSLVQHKEHDKAGQSSPVSTDPLHCFWFVEPKQDLDFYFRSWNTYLLPCKGPNLDKKSDGSNSQCGDLPTVSMKSSVPYFRYSGDESRSGYDRV